MELFQGIQGQFNSTLNQHIADTMQESAAAES
jgi:hypothetical protein